MIHVSLIKNIFKKEEEEKKKRKERKMTSMDPTNFKATVPYSFPLGLSHSPFPSKDNSCSI